MKTLVTHQGTATSETALCEECFPVISNQTFAREQAEFTDDIDPSADFVDCSENTAITCCICGP